MVLLSKTLSGGHVPVAAVLTRKYVVDGKKVSRSPKTS